MSFLPWLNKVYPILSLNFKRDSFWMVFDKRAASSAACNSKHGIVNFSGATRDFAATERISKSSIIFTPTEDMHMSRMHIHMHQQRYIVPEDRHC